MTSLEKLLRTPDLVAFYHALAHAELAREISELEALVLQARGAIAERNTCAADYLEMADAIARGAGEAALVSEGYADYYLWQGDPLAAARRCIHTLDHVYQTERLWNRLLIALFRLGDMTAVDATLLGFGRLDDESNARLTDALASDPALDEVRRRPAFRALLARRLRDGSSCGVTQD